jgi:hypothetical protein
MTVNSELERKWREAITVYFPVLTQENLKKP